MNEREALLILNRIPGIGPRTLQAIANQNILFSELFRMSRQTRVAVGLSSRQSEAIGACSVLNIREDLEWEAKEDSHHIITWEDDNYPALLKEIADAPPVLYAKGQIAALSFSKVAMVGTRYPSLSGLQTAKTFAKDLCQHELVIVSGLAKGIDTATHEACVSVGFPTIAVMGTGIDVIYPHQNRELAQKIVETGLLLTEFPFGTRPLAGHFPRRNRIISGLSLATLVIEASIRSGSLITARFAIEQNRDVLAVPGSIYHREAKGCHYLIQQGAKLVASAQDLLDEMGFLHPEQGAFVLKKKISPDASEETLLNLMTFEKAIPVDVLVSHSGKSLEWVLSTLAFFEIEGFVKAVCGGYVRLPVSQVS